MEQIHVTGTTKTHAGWDGSLRCYLSIGDCVDTGIYEHMRDVLPPRTFDCDLLQVGEADDHNGPDGAVRYTTFQKHGDLWCYTGSRVAGERVALLQAVKP